MNSPDVLDFDALLRPIAADQPTGPDLRADQSPTSPYYQIKDARASARAAERAGVLDESGRPSIPMEWQTVLRLAPQVLAAKSKDLEVVAWLVEALVRLHGFAGLRDGFRLAHGFVRDFWDGLYPTPDEDGIATRVAPLVGLNGGEAEGTLAAPIALAPITEEGEHGTFGLWRYSRVRELQRTGNDAGAAAVGTVDQFENTVRATSPEFFRCLVGDVDAALEHFAQLTAVLDEKCGAESPPSSALRGTLQEARQTIVHVMSTIAGVMPDADVAGEPAAADGPAAAAEPQAAVAAASRPAAAAGEIRTREDAFRVLSRAADWFRDNEPHSPLSSLLYQAVRWGKLPLRQLIEELIPDSGARDHFGLLTGLGRSAQQESNS